MDAHEKPLFALGGIELTTPPLSAAARREAGYLLGILQMGDTLAMPQARPMPEIAPGIYELRVRDAQHNWRIIYRADADRVVLIHQFAKTTRKTPQPVIELCRARLRAYDVARPAAKENQ